MAASQPCVNLYDPTTVLFVVDPSLFDVKKSRVPMKLSILSLSHLYPENEIFGCH